MASVRETYDYIKVNVPEGFLPQSVPVKPDERISSSNIRLETLKKEDLIPLVCDLSSQPLAVSLCLWCFALNSAS